MGGEGWHLTGARECYRGTAGSTILSPGKLSDFTIQSSTVRCQLCPNSCILTVHRFPGANTYTSGNRCERGSGKAGNNLSLPNLFVYKHKRLFGHYRSTPESSARRGRIGLPRVLNIYDNYPFWHTLFTQLGFSVQLSAPSSTSVYEKGMETIPSESVCYPAKLAHGHIVDLIDAGCDLIFYPSIVYEAREQVKAENNFNCPIAISYPETIKNNVYDLRERVVTLLKPFLPYEHPARMTRRLWEELRHYGVERSEVNQLNRIRLMISNAFAAREFISDPRRLQCDAKVRIAGVSRDN